MKLKIQSYTSVTAHFTFRNQTRVFSGYSEKTCNDDNDDNEVLHVADLMNTGGIFEPVFVQFFHVDGRGPVEEGLGGDVMAGRLRCGIETVQGGAWPRRRRTPTDERRRPTDRTTTSLTESTYSD